MKVALLGLMQSGKSSILSTISGKAMPQLGSTAIEEAMVPVPDERIDWLTEFYKPKKTTLATIDCLDLPGLSFTDEHGSQSWLGFSSRSSFGNISRVFIAYLLGDQFAVN